MARQRKTRVQLMIACNEIRRLRVEEGLSNLQIMQAMKLPPSDFYYYQQKIIEQDMRELERISNGLLGHQIIVLRERLEDSYRNLSQIAKDNEAKDQDRIEAEHKRMEVAINILKLQKEGPNAVGLVGYYRQPEQEPAIIKAGI